MKHSRFLVNLILATFLFQGCFMFTVEDHEDKVILSCAGNITWREGTQGKLLSDNKSLDLGKSILDPRGVYQCNMKAEKETKLRTMQVYFRMCQNCVELDSATLAGIIITDFIATMLLALGVYCFAGHETGSLSRATDTKKALLRNDQLYQPLRDRDDAQYSRLGENWPQNK